MLRKSLLILTSYNALQDGTTTEGVSNPITFGNAYQQISFLGMSHVICSIIWYQVCNSRPCCFPRWRRIEFKIMWNFLNEAGNTGICIPSVFVAGCYLLWNDIYSREMLWNIAGCTGHRYMWEIGVLQKNQIRLCFDLGSKGTFTNSVSDTVMCTKVNNLQHERVSASLDF